MPGENNTPKSTPREGNDVFIDKLSARLKQAELAPYPRWRFLLKDYVVWAAGALALACGSLAVTVMIYLVRFNDWEIRESTHKSLGEFILLTLPYFWLIFLGLFVFVLYLNLKHTKQGYRYPVWLIASASILASVIVGSLLSLTNIGERLDNILGARAPFYDQMINRQMHFWAQPEDGRLTGLMVASSTSGFTIIDTQGRLWEVIILEETRLPGFLAPGTPLNLIGRITDDLQFQADLIRPVGPGKGFLNRSPHAGDCSSQDCRLERPLGQPLR